MSGGTVSGDQLGPWLGSCCPQPSCLLSLLSPHLLPSPTGALGDPGEMSVRLSPRVGADRGLALPQGACVEGPDEERAQ